jgi:hypothetical protein
MGFHFAVGGTVLLLLAFGPARRFAGIMGLTGGTLFLHGLQKAPEATEAANQLTKNLGVGRQHGAGERPTARQEEPAWAPRG